MSRVLVRSTRISGLPQLTSCTLPAGYKVRTYLAKSLQRRCKAIRAAVDQYNAAASALTPARPTISWEKISHYSFLEEFALLEGANNDVRTKPWSRPEVREAMRLSKRIKRAHEEIDNANREVRRVHSAIRAEEIQFREVLARLKADNDPLHGAVEEYCRHRRAANARNMAYIEKIHGLDGFTGDRTAGHRRGTAPSPPLESTVNLPTLQEANAIRADDADSGVTDSWDDGLNDEVVAIVEYLAALTT